MNGSREDLLQASLTADERPAAAPYSVTSTFVSGFLGGPFAALALLVTNSVRLRRSRRDLPAWIAIILLVCLAGWLPLWMAPELATSIQTASGKSDVRMVTRVIALLIATIGYLMHRREQRNTDLAGLSRPNGWIGGIVCILAGAAVQIPLMYLLLR